MKQTHSHVERSIESNDNSYGQTSTRHDIRLHSSSSSFLSHYSVASLGHHFIVEEEEEEDTQRPR